MTEFDKATNTYREACAMVDELKQQYDRYKDDIFKLETLKHEARKRLELARDNAGRAGSCLLALVAKRTP